MFILIWLHCQHGSLAWTCTENQRAESFSLNSLSHFLCIVWSLGDINRCRKDPIMFTKRQFPLTWLYLRICTSVLSPLSARQFMIFQEFFSFFFFEWDLTSYLSSAVRLCYYISKAKTFTLRFEIQIKFDWMFLFLILNSVLVIWPFYLKQRKCHLYCWSAAVWSSVEALLFYSLSLWPLS